MAGGPQAALQAVSHDHSPDAGQPRGGNSQPEGPLVAAEEDVGPPASGEE